MSMIGVLSNNLAIDLGTNNTLVYKTDKGIVLSLSSSVALDIRSGEIIAVGNKALEMYGKTPENITIVKPLENGTVSDFDITKLLVKFCLEKSLPKFNLIQPKIVITAPVGVSDIELRAIEDACIHSGAREVYIVESAISSAIGAGFDVLASEGRLIINFGAGSTEIAVISLGGIVISKNLRFGGNKLDEDIADYVYRKYSVFIGENTAREAKEKIASVRELNINKHYEISGRDLLSGMPVKIDIFQSDIKEAIIKRIYSIIDAIKFVLEKNPPELSSDILNNGIFLTGGSSMLDGLQELLQNEIGIKVHLSENPLSDSVNGAGNIVKNLKTYKKFGM